MAVTTRWYPKGQQHFINGDIDWDGATGINFALLDSAAVFDDTDEFFNTHIVTGGDEYSGTGYTTKGTVLASRAINQLDSSVLTARANSTAYAVGDLVRAATDTGAAYLCVVAGTSEASEPTEITSGTVGVYREFAEDGAAGTLVWLNIGRSITGLDSAAYTKTGLDGVTGTNGGVIFVDGSTPGTDDYLIAFVDFGATETPTDITVTPPTDGWVALASGDGLS